MPSCRVNGKKRAGETPMVREKRCRRRTHAKAGRRQPAGFLRATTLAVVERDATCVASRLAMRDLGPAAAMPRGEPRTQHRLLELHRHGVHLGRT